MENNGTLKNSLSNKRSKVHKSLKNLNASQKIYPHNKRRTNNNGKGSIINSIANFLSKGWETITTPSSARCEAYSAQANYAQEEMKKDNISRKDRKFWSKQNDKAMNGLAEVHHTNSETFVKAICAIGAGLLIGNKLLNNKK